MTTTCADLLAIIGEAKPGPEPADGTSRSPAYFGMLSLNSPVAWLP